MGEVSAVDDTASSVRRPLGTCITLTWSMVSSYTNSEKKNTRKVEKKY